MIWLQLHFISVQRSAGPGRVLWSSDFSRNVSRSAIQTRNQSERAKRTTQAISLIQCGTGLSIARVKFIVYNAGDVRDR